MIYDEILGLLDDEEVGASGWQLRWGFMPDAPDTIVSFYEYQGEEEVTTKTGLVRTRPRLQVITRSGEYGDAMAKALQVRAVLTGVSGDTLGLAFYDAIDPLQWPFSDPAGLDANKRTRIIANYRLKRRPPGTPTN